MGKQPIPNVKPEEGFCAAREDKMHCVHWWDGAPCCSCGFNGGLIGDETPGNSS